MASAFGASEFLVSLRRCFVYERVQEMIDFDEKTVHSTAPRDVGTNLSTSKPNKIYVLDFHRSPKQNRVSVTERCSLQEPMPGT